MATFEIPLNPYAEDFSITIGGKDYSTTVRWCEPMGRWILNLSSDSGVPILQGLPLNPGINLLGQHQHLGIGGELFAQVDHDNNAAPSFDNLGSTGHLYLVTS